MTIKDWKSMNADDLEKLYKHMNDHGAEYTDVENLLADMLDDVLDLWMESHENDECENH